ncbi:MAG: undecaprenyl-diphosphatase UppP [Candidatus Magasanikbacteria bacterium CG1_02_41_34]|nr:MAG: undecaprenyl-diphosphatase UppP [Candidatus Magasanikbacteria bacterium CG1_02_41_34]
MNILHALTLGLIQGLTEFLPVSSSGHLIFVPHIFGWPDQGLTFDVIVHLGTLFAVVMYFRLVLWRIVKAFFSWKPEQQTDVLKQDRMLGWMLLLSVIPAIIVGLVFDIFKIEFRSVALVAYGLIFWAIILGIADRYNRKLVVHRENVTWKDAVVIGLAQVLALFPGTSRSGITMTAGLFSKLSKKEAAEFSFLMIVPIIAMAGALKVLEFLTHGGEGVTALPLTIGFLASAVSGYIAIWGLLKIIKKWSFMPFVVYRIVIAILILVFLV